MTVPVKMVSLNSIVDDSNICRVSRGNHNGKKRILPHQKKKFNLLKRFVKLERKKERKKEREKKKEKENKRR